MESKQERLNRRNKAIRTSFNKKTKAQSKWTIEAVIESVAKEFYLSVRTINAVISYEGIYK